MFAYKGKVNTHPRWHPAPWNGYATATPRACFTSSVRLRSPERLQAVLVDRVEQLLQADGECESGTGRCQRLESQRHQYAGRPRVPGIGYRKDPGPIVEGFERFSARRLSIHSAPSDRKMRGKTGTK